MLRLTFEIFPGGDKSQRRVLAFVDITNESNLARRSDYSIQVRDEKEQPIGFNPLSVKEYHRAEGFLSLSSIALRLCVDEGMETHIRERQQFYASNQKQRTANALNVYNASPPPTGTFQQPPTKPK